MVRAILAIPINITPYLYVIQIRSVTRYKGNNRPNSPVSVLMPIGTYIL